MFCPDSVTVPAPVPLTETGPDADVIALLRLIPPELSMIILLFAGLAKPMFRSVDWATKGFCMVNKLLSLLRRTTFSIPFTITPLIVRVPLVVPELFPSKISLDLPLSTSIAPTVSPPLVFMLIPTEVCAPAKAASCEDVGTPEGDQFPEVSQAPPELPV